MDHGASQTLGKTIAETIIETLDKIDKDAFCFSCCALELSEILITRAMLSMDADRREFVLREMFMYILEKTADHEGPPSRSDKRLN